MTKCPDCFGTGWEAWHNCLDPAHVACEDDERPCFSCRGSGDATRRGDWCDDCHLTGTCPSCTAKECA